MYIQYSNLTIRDATSDDAVQLAEWWNDGEVMAHAGFPLGLGTTAEKVAESLKLDRDDTRRRLIIEVDSVRVGEMSYRRVDAAESNAAADAGNNDKASDPYAARNDGTPLAPTAEIGVKICDPASQNLCKFLAAHRISSFRFAQASGSERNGAGSGIPHPAAGAQKSGKQYG